MKQLFFIAGFLGWLSATAQPGKRLTIGECYDLARTNYPMVKKQELIAKTKEFTIENIGKANLPQLSIQGQATYQSDVTEIPVKLPNTQIPTLSKDQYKLYAEINQSVFDGGVNKLQKESAVAEAEVDQQKLGVELYKLNERINQLYFGILLADEQLAQNEMLKKDIGLGLSKAKAAIANGTALKSSGDALEAEILKVAQRGIELKSIRQAYADMLSLFINHPIDEKTVFEKPSKINFTETINRPELKLYDTEKKSLDIQGALVDAKNLPRVNLFVQGGYGRPGLNMLQNDFDLYYIGGVKLNWSLSGLYTSKKEKALIQLKSRNVDLLKETFLFNTNLEVKKQVAGIKKIEELMRTDDEIINLRNKIKNTALAQLEYGVINSSDYIREVNAEDQAKQSRLLHEIQLLMVYYELQTTTGK